MIYTQPQPDTELARIYKVDSYDEYGGRPQYRAPVRCGTNIMFSSFDKLKFYRNHQYRWFYNRGITCFRDLWDFSERRDPEFLKHAVQVIAEMGERGADVTLCLLGASSWALDALTDSQRAAVLNYAWEQTGNERYCGKLMIAAYRAAGHTAGLQRIQDWLGEKYTLLEPVMEHVYLELENEIRNWKPVDPKRHLDFLRSIKLDPIYPVEPIEVPDNWKPRNLADMGITPVHAYNDWSTSLNRGVQWHWNKTAGTKRWWVTEIGLSPEFHNRTGVWYHQIANMGAERIYTHTDVLCAHVRKDWETPGATYQQYHSRTGNAYALSKAGGVLQHDGVSVLVPKMSYRLAAIRFDLAQAV